MTLDETTFQKAWGRAPSAASLARLRRLQEALGVAENDGLVTIAMVFEFYDDLYRQYPDQCAEAAREAVHDGLASAASLSVAAVQQAIEQGLASLGPRCAIAAKQAVREELAAARALPSRGGRAPQSTAPELALRRLLALWIAYSAMLGAICYWAGGAPRAWAALAAVTAGFAGLLLLTRAIGR